MNQGSLVRSHDVWLPEQIKPPTYKGIRTCFICGCRLSSYSKKHCQRHTEFEIDEFYEQKEKEQIRKKKEEKQKEMFKQQLAVFKKWIKTKPKRKKSTKKGKK
jgi:hypothetical protein